MLLPLVAICVAAASVLAAQVGAAEPPQRVSAFGREGQGPGAVVRPGGAAVSPDGTRLFIADTGNHRIVEFTTGGEFLRAWGWGVIDGSPELQTCTTECTAGQSGRQPGELNEPVGVAAGPGGVVYVINRAKGDGRIQRFATSGETVTYAGALPAGYGKTGAGAADLTYPLPLTNDVAVDSNGKVYVADNDTAEGVFRVFVYSPKTSAFTEIAVSFGQITAIAVSPGGRLYVGEESGNVESFDPAGGSSGTFSSGASGIKAMVVEPGSGNLLIEPDAIDARTESSELTELSEEGEFLRKISVAGMTPAPVANPNPFGLAFSATEEFEEEGSGRPNEPGAIYVVNRYEGTVNLLAERTPLEPAIYSAGATAGVEGADLTATIDPEGSDTHAYFEYGTTPAYGLTSPAAPGYGLGAGFTAKTVTAYLSGLQPDTTYHYAVVATNAVGTTTTADATFTTFAVGGSFSLPDGRAYEQVTTEKGTTNVTGLFAAREAEKVAFASPSPLPGSASGSLNSSYVAQRSPDGWHTYGATPPVEDALGADLLISPDLSQSVGVTSKRLTGDSLPGTNLYLRDNATGTETLMTPLGVERDTRYRAIGSSADFGRIFFLSGSALTPDTPERANPEEERQSLYEWHGGTLRNVGILPGAGTPTEATVEAGLGYLIDHSVSEDGSRVFFTTAPAPGGEGEPDAARLFVRIDGNRTVEVSASQASVADPEAASQEAQFVGAAADGSSVFFKSSARLTDDAYTGAPGDRAPNLYRYDVEGGELVDISVARGPADEELGADVGGVAPAADGRSAYFVARGILATGGVSGQPNLYRWREGRGVVFVAVLGEGDPLVGSRLAAASAPMTADGSTLAFISAKALDPAYPNAEGVNEIYRYSATGGPIVCVSCARAGTGQTEAELAAVYGFAAGYGGDSISSDGNRIFFQGAAAIVPGDTNGKSDVYEWEGGSARLISSGSGSGATLIGASDSGDDVYFLTASRLVLGDRDSFVDVYDARVGGGLPAPPESTPCEAQDCRAPALAPPATSYGSRSFDGPGDKKAKHRRKKHRQKRHHGRKRGSRHGKHGNHGKQQRSHGHPAVGKRG